MSLKVRPALNSQDRFRPNEPLRLGGKCQALGKCVALYITYFARNIFSVSGNFSIGTG